MDPKLFESIAKRAYAKEREMRSVLNTPPGAGGAFSPQCDAYGQAMRDLLAILSHEVRR